MLKQLVLLHVLYFSILSMGYTQSFVKGKIISKNNAPIKQVTLNIYRVNDTAHILVKTIINNNDGTFNAYFPDTVGSHFMLQIVDKDFETQKNLFILSQDTTVLAPIVLENRKTLDEVVVSTPKKKSNIEVLPDKTIFKVSDNIGAQGLNTLELLRKTPGVFIDKDDNISLKGLSGVQVYIDGRPSYMTGKDLANYLQGVSADDIDNIEIISNPSAAYEAQGQAGIINIKFKQGAQRTGVNGNVFANQSYSLLNNYIGNFGGSINYRTNKLLVYASYSFRNSNYTFQTLFNRIANDSAFYASSKGINRRNDHNINTGIEYMFKKNHTLIFNFKGNFSNSSFSMFSTTNVSPSTNIDNVVYAIRTSQRQPSTTTNLIPSLTYNYQDEKDNQFKVEANYSYYDTDPVKNSYNDVSNYFYNVNGQITDSSIYKQQTPNLIQIFSLKTDIVRHLSFGKLNAGIKISTVNNHPIFYSYDITHNASILNLLQSNNFIYTENIYAAYVEYVFSAWKKKLNFQVGLRDEATQSRGLLKEINTNQIIRETTRLYNGLFPSVGIQYDINDKHSLSLQYSRRIDRPAYSLLNPFLVRNDALTFMQGNPYMLPAYINKITLTYLLFSTYTVDISYTHTSNFMGQVIDSFENSKLLITQKNIATNQGYNLHIGIPVSISKIAKWYNAYIDFNSMYSELAGNNQQQKYIIRNWTFSGSMEHNFTIKNWFNIQISGWIQKSPTDGGIRVDNVLGSLDCAIQKKIFQNKLSIKLTWQDLLHTQYVRFSNLVGASLYGSARWDSRKIGLNLSYTFGSNKITGSKMSFENDSRLQQQSGGFGK